MEERKLTAHEIYAQAALSKCGLTAWPPRTLMAYQCHERPNRFYPIRFSIPKGMTFQEIVDPKNDWVIVVIEFSNGKPYRWASFKAAFFRNTQWVPDRAVVCVAVVASVIAHALESVDGEQMSLLPSISLRDWMQNRKKETQ